MPRRAQPPRLYLRNRADGQAVWIILDRGQQISTGAAETERGVAETALAKYLGEKHKPDFGDHHPDHVAIADALTVYVEKHAPTVARPYLIALAAERLNEFFGDKAASYINANTCADYVAWRTAQTDGRAKRGTGRPISAATAGRELVVLRAALNRCWEAGDLDRPIAVPTPPPADPRERHLTRQEAARLLWGALGFDANGHRHRDRINRHLARFILLGLYTGTRHAALLRLQWLPSVTGGWVDLPASEIGRIGVVQVHVGFSLAK